MRGHLHQRLVAALLACIKDGVCTQESLARAVGMHQTTVSGILNRNAGTLDLDEAEAALQHIGSSLEDFLAGRPARQLTEIDRLARTLATRRGLLPWVEGLLRVPESRLPGVLALIDVGVRAGTGQPVARNTESQREPTAARRATRAPAQRPRAPKRS